MKQKSNMKHSFANVPKAEISRSAFDRSHSYKTTFDSDYLIPFLVEEVLPGDSFQVSTTLFARMMSALTVPSMDNLHLDTFYFFVPNRLVWENWQRFMGERDPNPDSSISFVIPTLTYAATGNQGGRHLGGYFGIQSEKQLVGINVLPYRAYNLIYNSWFRDQNLQESIFIAKDDGPDAWGAGWPDGNYIVRKRGKRPDYFTSCLPWPQKGDAVSIPMTGDAPISGLGKHDQTFGGSTQAAYETDGTRPTYASFAFIDGVGGGSAEWLAEEGDTGYPNIYANLSNVGATTINELREAFALQKLLERDARGGTRYTELVKSHFGVTSPDSRLQRPEYLGGNSKPIMINPVEQTSVTAGTPQANVAAFGTGINQGGGFSKSFTEHGYIIGILNVRADVTYQKGVDRMWSRSTKNDFFWPALQHIGEQAVLSKEIFADTTGDDELVFGYQERFAEYRSKQSLITGQLRSVHGTSLDLWHLSQDFGGSRPTLSAAFILSSTPLDRCLAVTSEPQFVLDSYIKMKVVRPMATYSVPGLIDHF